MKLSDLIQVINKCSKDLNTKAYLCGGLPRDKQLNILDEVHDIDITTGNNLIFSFGELVYKSINKNLNVESFTSKDGHRTLKFKNISIDFSSNYNEPNITEILKSKLANPSSLQKEMYSRDFTCNSLLMDFDFKTITDPTGNGLNDIKNKLIKTNLDPKITLSTMPNRVVRAIYLACKLNFTIDPVIISFIKSNPQVSQISNEKTTKEKLDLAFSSNPEKAVKIISEMNIWEYLPITSKMQPYYLKRDSYVQ